MKADAFGKDRKSAGRQVIEIENYITI